MHNNKRIFTVLIPAALICASLTATALGAKELRHATGYAPGSMGAESTNAYAKALEKISGVMSPPRFMRYRC